MKTILSIFLKTLSINGLIVVLCLVIYSIGVNAKIYYVKPVVSGFGFGTSWANASNNIQAMMNIAEAGDSIWVAAGEYKPNSTPYTCFPCVGSKFYTFYIKDGIQLFGNFNGTETDVNQRDFGTNTTFLSGDLYGDDVVSGSLTDLTITGNTENVYHVILICDESFGNQPIKIDGFTIKGGNATGTYLYTVNDISISPSEGGGIYAKNQITTITNCFIVNNSAKYGGGIYSDVLTSFINNNIIANNFSSQQGGGMVADGNTNEILNNSFIGNYGSGNGGAIYCQPSISNIINNEINGNAAGGGGGITLNAYGTYHILNNTITNNYAVVYGGGINCSWNTSIISDNIIAYNTVGTSGGGLYLNNGPYVVTNNVIYKNSAEISGGGIFNNINTNTITNNTFVGNSANSAGGGIYFNSLVNTFTNNIFWDNMQNTETNVSGADLFLISNTNIFQNNILQLDSTFYTGTNFSLGVDDQGNLFALNPLFLNIDNPQGEDLIYFTGDDGLRLQTNSPALNAGTITDAPETDILGTPRDVFPDIGAYENGVFVGIQPNTNSQTTATLNAYPNPASDAITFTFTTPTTDHSTLLLYAIDGRNITSLYKGLTQTGETNTLTIDTNQFTPGTYCAVLRCGNGLAQYRTIIIK